MTTQDNEQKKIQFPIKFWELKEIFEEHDYEEKQLEQYFYSEEIFDEKYGPNFYGSVTREKSKGNLSKLIHSITEIIETEIRLSGKIDMRYYTLKESAIILLYQDEGETRIGIEYRSPLEFEGQYEHTFIGCIYDYKYNCLKPIISCRSCSKLHYPYSSIDYVGLRTNMCRDCAENYPMDSISEELCEAIIDCCDNDVDSRKLEKEEKELLWLLTDPCDHPIEKVEDWKKLKELIKNLEHYSYLLDVCF